MSNQSLPSIHGTHIGTIYTNRSVNGISACIWFSQLNWFLLCCSFASAAPGAPSRDRYTVDQPGPSHLPGGTGGWVHAKDGAGNPRVYSTAHPFKGGGQGQTWEAQGEKRRASHICQYLSSKLQYLHCQHCSFEPSHWYMWTHVVWNCFKKKEKICWYFLLLNDLYFKTHAYLIHLIEHYFFWMTWILIWLKLISSCTQNLSGMTVPKSLQ